MLNMIDAAKTPVINGDGTQAYDFVTADDAARANIAALKSNLTDEFFNVGTGIETSIKDLCNLILALRKSDLKVQFKPYTDEDARRLVQNRVGSTKKAEKLLGFKHSTDLREGLLSLIEWRLNHEIPT